MKINFNKSELRKILSNRIIFYFVLFGIINFIAFAPVNNLVIDIISHFIMQYLVICLIFIPLIFIFIQPKKIRIIYVIISIVLLILNFYSLLPHYDSQIANTDMPSGIKIGLYNVLTQNTNYELFLEELKTEAPDIAVVQEVNSDWLEKIKAIKKEYAYNLEYPRDDNFGIAIYSKYPFNSSNIEFWTLYDIPVLSINIKNMQLYCVHTLPPTSRQYFSIRNEMLKNIAAKFNNKQSIIIAGDFNTTRFSHAYKTAIEKTGALDVQSAQKNLSGTWSTKFPALFRISLDHILISSGLSAKDFKIGKNFGSDHLPIYATIYDK